jgi:hypothetical protein
MSSLASSVEEGQIGAGMEQAEQEKQDESRSVTMSPLIRQESLQQNKLQRARSNTSSETDDKIQLFRAEREKKKQKSFWYIVRLSWTLMLTGMLGFCLDSALLYLLHGYPTFLSSVFSSFFMFVVGCGYLLFSTVPLDVLDVDAAVEKSYKMRLLFVLVGLLISIIFTLVPPYVHVVSSIIAVSGLYPDNKHSPYWNRFSFKVVLWFLSFASCMAVVYSYWCYKSSIDENLDGASIANLNVPMGEEYYNMYIVLSLYYGLTSILFMRSVYVRRRLYYTSNHEQGAGPTMGIYLSMYLWNFIFGVGLFINGIWLYVHYIAMERNDHDLLYFSSACIGVGVALLLPPVVVFVFSREAIFNIMSKRFDTDTDNLKQDGAFIAGLLDSVDIEEGQSWYIHREKPETTFDEFDHNRYWVRGRVVEISNTRIGVEKPSDENSDATEVTWIEMGATVDSDELLEMARVNLRCVDFETIIAKNLLTNGSVRDTGVESFYSLGRSVTPGEKIDFFISHSWHDSAEVKVEKLKVLGERFRKKYGRYPTFWLDKVCIDQSNIGSGLKVLPINVMACKQMLVLCGDTYSRRLWCVW